MQKLQSFKFPQWQSTGREWLPKETTTPQQSSYSTKKKFSQNQTCKYAYHHKHPVQHQIVQLHIRITILSTQTQTPIHFHRRHPQPKKPPKKIPLNHYTHKKTYLAHTTFSSTTTYKAPSRVQHQVLKNLANHPKIHHRSS